MLHKNALLPIKHGLQKRFESIYITPICITNRRITIRKGYHQNLIVNINF